MRMRNSRNFIRFCALFSIISVTFFACLAGMLLTVNCLVGVAAATSNQQLATIVGAAAAAATQTVPQSAHQTFEAISMSTALSHCAVNMQMPRANPSSNNSNNNCKGHIRQQKDK